MNIFKHLLVIIIVGTLVGCATARKDYGLHVANIEAVATNSQEALNQATPIELKLNDEQIWDITFQDPALEIDKTKNNYKVFKFSGKKDQKYKLELWSRCACFGFNKTLMVPNAIIVNGDGNVINNKPVEFGQGYMGFTRPMNIHGTWEGTFTDDSPLYFIVSSDNRALGKNAGSFTATSIAMPYMPIPLSMSHYPIGEIETKLVITNY